MRDTTGLKWAPEIGAKIEIIMTKVRPVGIALPNNVMTGGKVSTTFTVLEAVEVLPSKSVAV